MRFRKSFKATLDYTLIWTNYLDGSSIHNSEWNILTDTSEDENPLEIVLTKRTEDKTTVVVKGGDVNKRYRLGNIIQYVKNGDKYLQDKRYIEIQITE